MGAALADEASEDEEDGIVAKLQSFGVKVKFSNLMLGLYTLFLQ